MPLFRAFPVAAVALLGCGSPAAAPCMNAGGPGPLIAQSVVLQIDVYEGSVACSGGSVAGQPRPILSATFPVGAAIDLPIPSGRRTVLLRAFSDPGATHLVGSACQTADLDGSAVCLNLSLSAAGSNSDGGSNMSCPDVGCRCNHKWDCGVLSSLDCCNHTCVASGSDCNQ